jgi:hypothetical protein
VHLKRFQRFKALENKSTMTVTMTVTRGRDRALDAVIKWLALHKGHLLLMGAARLFNRDLESDHDHNHVTVTVT